MSPEKPLSPEGLANSDSIAPESDLPARDAGGSTEPALDEIPAIEGLRSPENATIYTTPETASRRPNIYSQDRTSLPTVHLVKVVQVREEVPLNQMKKFEEDLVMHTADGILRIMCLLIIAQRLLFLHIQFLGLATAQVLGLTDHGVVHFRPKLHQWSNR
ncbi:hypothetical protein B0H19DRAFT_1258028 [Mycena capillaripes]|nr:hypothetical protein B0H19DRAFT_1258028 [Mycena capillaripes]